MKNNGFEQTKTLEDLNEELLALKLRMAFQAEFEEELREMESAEPDPELQAMLVDAEPRMLRRIDKELRREQLRHMVRTSMPRVARACAVVLLVFYLGLTVAVATMEPVREGMLDFIQEITDKYTRFDIEPDEVEIPLEWEGEYFPTYIPKGFEKHSATKNSACYIRGKQRVAIYEYGTLMESNYDTEGSEVQTIMVKDELAYLSQKNGWTTVVMRVNDRYLMIDGNIAEDVILEIANSIE